jgi:kinesin family protein C1
VHDLLGTGEDRKHEIKHDARGTRVTDAAVLPLRSPAQVRALLARAQGRRSVAATLMNERSSRSHSVFTLRVAGANARTGERCDASLNLVDLAGSERLSASGAGADPARLRETQNINRSLSALGDVIAALGEKGERGEKHIPYRNSKLTYLLQNSLSGNSKTLVRLPAARRRDTHTDARADDPERVAARGVPRRDAVLAPVRDEGPPVCTALPCNSF